MSDQQCHEAEALCETSGGFSYFWDVYLPVGISSVPSLFFSLIRLTAWNLDGPQARIADWQILVLMVCELLGILSMAVVVLLRFDVGMKRLTMLSGGKPCPKRQRMLRNSVACLLLFDVFLNVGTAFAREQATPFISMAIVFYLLYLIGIRCSLYGLPEVCNDEQDSPSEHAS